MLAAAALLAACGGGSTSTGSTPKTLNVGLVAEFTGQHAPVGQSKEEGSQLAVKLINDAGGVLGGKFHVIDINASDPADAVPATRQALAVDSLHLVLGFSVVNYQNALPIVNSAKMVSFTYIGDPSIDNTLMPYSFRTQPSDSLVADAMALQASRSGYKRLALVFDATQGAQELVPFLQTAASKLNLSIVANEKVPLNVTSYEGEITQLLAAKPDAVLLQLDPEPAGLFFRQFKQLGGGGLPIIGSDLTANSEWVKAVGLDEAQKNVVSVTPSSGAAGQAGSYFTSAYQKMFNHPPRAWAPHFYDGMNVAALAMIDAKSTDPKVYVKDILDVTNPAPGHTVVYNFADGAKLLSEGKKIKYYGAGSPMTFNKYHDVTGDFEVVKVDSTGAAFTTSATIKADDLTKLIS